MTCSGYPPCYGVLVSEQWDERALGETIGKLVEGKVAEASAILTNVLVTAVTFPVLGSGAVGAGKAVEGAVRFLASRISQLRRRTFWSSGDATAQAALGAQNAVAFMRRCPRQ